MGMDNETENRIVEIIETARAEWDRVHANGWNTDYLTRTPSPWYLAARAIIKEFQLPLDHPHADIG